MYIVTSIQGLHDSPLSTEFVTRVAVVIAFPPGLAAAHSPFHFLYHYGPYDGR